MTNNNTIGLGIAFSSTGHIMVGIVTGSGYLAPMLFLEGIEEVSRFSEMLMEFYNLHKVEIPPVFREAFKNNEEK